MSRPAWVGVGLAWTENLALALALALALTLTLALTPTPTPTLNQAGLPRPCIDEPCQIEWMSDYFNEYAGQA